MHFFYLRVRGDRKVALSASPSVRPSASVSAMCQKCHIITRYEYDAADANADVDGERTEPRMYSQSDATLAWDLKKVS